MTPDIDASLLLPEVVLSITIVAVFVSDLAIGARGRTANTLLGALGCCVGLISIVVMRATDALGSTAGSSYVVDEFSLLAKGLILFAAAMVLVLQSPSTWRGEYNVMILCATLGALAVTSTRDLIMLVVAFELLAIPGYLLVAWNKRSKAGFEGALKYYLLGVVASATMLYGVSFLFGIAGGTSFHAVSAAVSRGADDLALTRLAVLLVMVGMAFKISAVPFHFWAPDAYQAAPIPVAAYLSVVSKLGGLVALILLTLVAFPAADAVWPPLLWVLAVVTMTVGNLAALRQKDVVRLLAYSSVAQAGYMLVPLAVIGRYGAQTTDGLSAVFAFMIIYAIMNIGAFAAVMALVEKTGTTDMDAMHGAHRVAPIPAVALSILLLSLAGVPPFAGWFAKLVIFQIGIEAGSKAAITLVVIAAINSALGLVYYAGVLRRIWIEPGRDASMSDEETGGARRIHPGTTLVMAVTCLAVVVFGVAPGLVGVLGEMSSLAR